jgi:hypothetical protein
MFGRHLPSMKFPPRIEEECYIYSLILVGSTLRGILLCLQTKDHPFSYGVGINLMHCDLCMFRFTITFATYFTLGEHCQNARPRTRTKSNHAFLPPTVSTLHFLHVNCVHSVHLRFKNLDKLDHP